MKSVLIKLLKGIVQTLISKHFFQNILDNVLKASDMDIPNKQKRDYVFGKFKQQNKDLPSIFINLAIETAVSYMKIILK